MAAQSASRPPWRRIVWISLAWLVAVGALLFGAWLLGSSLAGLFGVHVPLFPALARAAPVDHADLAALAVAGGTLLLAIATLLLVTLTFAAVRTGQREAAMTLAAIKAANRQADETAKQVAASQQQTAIARETLMASLRPILVNVPHGMYVRTENLASFGTMTFDDASVSVTERDESSSIVIDVPLRNIGAGPAIISGLGLRSAETEGWSGSVNSSIVAPGELVRLHFDVPLDRADVVQLPRRLRERQSFSVQVGFEGLAGDKWRTEAHVHCNGDASPPSWFFRQVALYRGNEQEPITISAPADLPYG